MAYAYTTYIILQTTLMHAHMCIHAQTQAYVYAQPVCVSVYTLCMQESGLVLVK